MAVMNNLLDRIVGSQPIQLVLAVVVYALYAVVLGLCLTPPLAVVLWGWTANFPVGVVWQVGPLVTMGLALGGAYFVFLMTSTVIMGLLIRLLTLGIGDNVTVGGGAEISCHLWENDTLILDRIKIGSGTLIGANAYISPGVEIGENSVVGLGSYVRRGTKVPPKSRLTRVGAVTLRRAAELERG
jgi:acetyltransferase-like isoleucine patch superfamily enzyme